MEFFKDEQVIHQVTAIRVRRDGVYALGEI